MTATDLATYVSAPSANAYVEGCWAAAETLVGKLVGTREVPAEILGRAKLEVGAHLYHLNTARLGIAQIDSGELAAPIRVGRDPLACVRPMLRAWLGGGFA